MSTYREVIGEIVPTYAIAEAERRVYDRLNGIWDAYACQDGRCAMGVMLWVMHSRDESTAKFPDVRRFAGTYEVASPTVRRRRLALNIVMRANDRGLLATPGSLTALLDRECKVVVR